MMKQRIPGARIDWNVNKEWDRLLQSASHPVDDSSSISEWGWKPKYDSWEKIIDAYLEALN